MRTTHSVRHPEEAALLRGPRRRHPEEAALLRGPRRRHPEEAALLRGPRRRHPEEAALLRGPRRMTDKDRGCPPSRRAEEGAHLRMTEPGPIVTVGFNQNRVTRRSSGAWFYVHGF